MIQKIMRIVSSWVTRFFGMIAGKTGKSTEQQKSSQPTSEEEFEDEWYGDGGGWNV